MKSLPKTKKCNKKHSQKICGSCRFILDLESIGREILCINTNNTREFRLQQTAFDKKACEYFTKKQ